MSLNLIVLSFSVLSTALQGLLVEGRHYKNGVQRNKFQMGNNGGAVNIIDNTVHQGGDQGLGEDEGLDEIVKPSNYRNNDERDQRKEYISNLYDLASGLREYLDGSERKLRQLLEALGDTPEDVDSPKLMNQNVQTYLDNRLLIGFDVEVNGNTYFPNYIRYKLAASNFSRTFEHLLKEYSNECPAAVHTSRRVKLIRRHHDLIANSKTKPDSVYLQSLVGVSSSTMMNNNVETKSIGFTIFPKTTDDQIQSGHNHECVDDNNLVRNTLTPTQQTHQCNVIEFINSVDSYKLAYTKTVITYGDVKTAISKTLKHLYYHEETNTVHSAADIDAVYDRIQCLLKRGVHEPRKAGDPDDWRCVWENIVGNRTELARKFNHFLANMARDQCLDGLMEVLDYFQNNFPNAGETDCEGNMIHLTKAGCDPIANQLSNDVFLSWKTKYNPHNCAKKAILDLSRLFEEGSDPVNAKLTDGFKWFACGSKPGCLKVLETFEGEQGLKGFWKELKNVIPRLIRILHSLHMGTSKTCYKANDTGLHVGGIGGWIDFCAGYSKKNASNPSFWEKYLEDPVLFK